VEPSPEAQRQHQRGMSFQARLTVVCVLTLSVVLACSLAGSANAAPGDVGVTQVADINPGGDSFPGGLTSINGTLLFAADDGTTGRELWKSTGPGATRVHDIDPAPGSGSSPDELTNVGGTLFFAADDGTDGRELWKSAPPYATATQVADINPIGSSNPDKLANVNGIVFFSADDGTNGRELWASDGGPLGSGTEMVDDINPGGDSSPEELTPFTSFNGTIAFAADDGTDGEELWKSDGSTATQIADINPGPASSSLNDLTDLDGSLFFAADGGADGEELWTSDGNTAFQVADIRPGGNSSSPDQLTDVDGTLFFRASDGVTGFELWKSDGGPLGFGTELVADIRPGANSSSSPSELTNVDGTVFFDASDGSNGFELWKSDGGPLGAGTEMVADINPSGNSGPEELTTVDGALFLNANDGTNGRELWRSTGAGATMVADIDPSPGSGSFPRALTDVDGTLFFGADDGADGDELWRTTVESPAPPPPRGEVTTDTEVVLDVDARGRQRVGKLKLAVSCGDERCDVEATGKAVARPGKRGAAAAAKRSYRLKPAAVSVAAGQRRTVRLKLKRHARSVRKLRRLLQAKSTRKRSKAKIEVGATDAAANATTEKVTIKLRR
jgi:ELWxxDGT repeat protein